ncbi:MAG: 16S rRNA (uracil(1498)-N(3))-methyltransferase [Bacillota bacterium]
MAHHFIVNTKQIRGNKVTIIGEDFTHLTRVLRLKCGDKITVADGSGNLYFCLLEEIYQKEAVGRIVETTSDKTEPPLELVLIQGLPKGDKLEFIIQKATELGVAGIVPVAMHRSVVQLSKAKATDRNIRWQKIAQEAAKQCRRSWIPQVEYSPTFEEALDKVDKDALILLPWEGERTEGIKEVLNKARNSKERQIVLLIGPEGGFEDQEVELARRYGAISLSLGPRILRVETAAIVAITMVMYELGDLGGVSVDK